MGLIKQEAVAYTGQPCFSSDGGVFFSNADDLGDWIDAYAKDWSMTPFDVIAEDLTLVLGSLIEPSEICVSDIIQDDIGEHYVDGLDLDSSVVDRTIREWIEANVPKLYEPSKTLITDESLLAHFADSKWSCLNGEVDQMLFVFRQNQTTNGGQ